MTSFYQLKNISFNYGDDTHSQFNLSDINLEIKKNHLVAIVGPNGSGKTSLLNLLSFLNLPLQGELRYNDEPLSLKNVKSLRKAVGYVQQSPYLLRGTVFENIELGLKLKHVSKVMRQKKVDEVMQLLSITHLSARAARSLSGGEAQKVAIGQVLVLDPEVLILDEPFTHLDKQSINELEQLVLALKNDLNKTVIFTTHNQIQAQCLADTIYSVINGKVFAAHLTNVFSGVFDSSSKTFRFGNIVITMPEDTDGVRQIAIDPKQIVISKEQLDSSMQNSFSGKIIGMQEEDGKIKLNVDIGEEIQAIITHKALNKLSLSMGTDVWISFKSSSIVIF